MHYQRPPLLLAVLLLPLAGCATTPSSTEWQSLFDGKTLEGWRAYRGTEISPASWQVEDGAIVSKSRPGEIVTLSTYQDFELTFSWRVTTGANSGVFYRVSETERQVHESGLEYQVLDNVGQAGRPQTEQAAACYGVVPAVTDATRPVGEWNDARITVRGQHIEHSLNGQVIAAFDFGSPDWNRRVAAGPLRSEPRLGLTEKGHIALQNYHGHEVAYRNLRIRRLHP